MISGEIVFLSGIGIVIISVVIFFIMNIIYYRQKKRLHKIIQDEYGKISY